MEDTIQKSRKQIIAKRKKLEVAAETLKKEFAGLDEVIDKVINTISSWYIFPYVQKKPLVVNLWGLTGTGKTTLVNRLVELLGLSNYTEEIDIKSLYHDGHGLHGTFKELASIEGVAPVIILDEFQFMRTIDEKGRELEMYSSSLIWELLDSGKFIYGIDNLIVSNLRSTISYYRWMLSLGVKYEKGVFHGYYQVPKRFEKRHELIYVMEGDDLERYEKKKKKKRSQYPGTIENLFNEESLEYIVYLFNSRFKDTGEVISFLEGIGVEETIDFVEKVLEKTFKNAVVDVSHGLIFILGNLDEAYEMGRNFSTDLSADDFYEETLKINITHIKEALKRRFRIEQIARLGNNHILYPALNNAAYEKIIDMELLKIKSEMAEKFNFNLDFTPSLKKYIYEAGVFPVQGARPLISTIQKVVSSKLSKIFSEMLIRDLLPDKVIMEYSEELIRVTYFENDHAIFSFTEKEKQDLVELRKPKQNDKQALVAVHESGHAVLRILLEGIIPEKVLSVPTSDDYDGFTLSYDDEHIHTKKNAIGHLAYMLGGFVAEKLVFGPENVSSGSNYDLSEATRFAFQLLAKSGFGKSLANFSIYNEARHHGRNLFDENNEITRQALSWFEEAQELAEKTLQENFYILLEMSDLLSDVGFLEKHDIVKLFEKNGYELPVRDSEDPGTPFRRMLKTVVKQHRRESNLGAA